MPGDCSIRALWILHNLDAVVFSRRFPVVEKRWRVACQSENESSDNDPVKYTVFSSLPSDSELTAAFSDRKISGLYVNLVSIYPAVKAPVELSARVTSGDYILWNTLGKCPSAVTA